MRTAIVMVLCFVTFSTAGVNFPDMVFVEGGVLRSTTWSADQQEAVAIPVDGIWVAKYETTQAEWRAFVEESEIDWDFNEMLTATWNSTHIELVAEDNWPVYNASWIRAIRYCNWLSTKLGYDSVYEIQLDSENRLVGVSWDTTANGFRLLTDVEWDFVARGGIHGQQLRYPGSDDVDEVAWYTWNAGDEPHPVGSKMENILGLEDMAGNVSEWCWDLFALNYIPSAEDAYLGPAVGESNSLHWANAIEERTARVIRGGNFTSSALWCETSHRGTAAPERDRVGPVGIRVALNTKKDQ